MGIFDFMKDAGEKIFKPGEDRKEKADREAPASGLGIDVSGVKVEVEGSKAHPQRARAGPGGPRKGRADRPAISSGSKASMTA